MIRPYLAEAEQVNSEERGRERENTQAVSRKGSRIAVHINDPSRGGKDAAHSLTLTDCGRPASQPTSHLREMTGPGGSMATREWKK